MLKKIMFAGCLAFGLQTAEAQLKWPAITQTTRPWTRWWWEGSAVDKAGLTHNLQQYQQAGLGGVEITPIYGIRGYEKRHISFLSPQWMQMLQHTLAESKRLGLGVDMANATGWPFGGPWTTEADASKTVYTKSWTVEGGQQLAEPVQYIHQPWIRTASTKPVSIDTLKRPVWENTNLQDLALDQVQFGGPLPLQCVMAYGPDGAVVDLTGKTNAGGKLDWTAPAGGEWKVYALFEGLHGKMVERAAPGGEGYAIDHFSAQAANNYFKRFDEAFKGANLQYLRGFFNDSYEVDDARGQANWTSNLFGEFLKRKGYDLRQHLPALFATNRTASQLRVLYDYRSVIDELILENFTEVWKKWAGDKGKIVRNQSHGSPANTLDLYSVVDIPETEGRDVLRFKFASSAANVSGKRLTSSESATWLNEHFLSSWGDVKKALDLFFLGGVNHIFYHGTEYSPADAPWPGWLFYAAVHFQPTNPQWAHFGQLNQYVTRTQSFLQQGKPNHDVLLYYPIVDRYSQETRELLQHFDGMEKNFENTDFEHVSKWMEEKGYTFDFFSERQLAHMTAGNGRIVTGGNQFKTILLPANKLINADALKQLLDLAAAGATVLVYKLLPADVPGLANLNKRQQQYRQLVKMLQFKNEAGVQAAIVGKGRVVVSSNLEALMQAAAIGPEPMTEHGLQFERRQNQHGTLWFINNRHNEAFEGWVALSGDEKQLGLFDPMTGQKGLAAMRKKDGHTEVWLELPAWGSLVVQGYKIAQADKAYPYRETSGEAVTLTGPWKLDFVSGGPTLPGGQMLPALQSWTEASDEAKNFSGIGTYTTTVAKPAGSAIAYRLDLGKVHATAEVWLNGKKLATLIGPSFTTDIPASLLLNNNKLVVRVANLMANRISYMDKNNLPWKIFYNVNMPARLKENAVNGIFSAAAWQPLPSGLLGPVTLTPLRVREGR